MSLRYSRWSFEDIFLWCFYNIRQISVCGQLVHSRKRGDGLVDNAGKMNTILRSVETIISNDAWDFLPSKNSMMSCPIKFSLTILMMILREGKKFEPKWIFCLDYFINPAVLQFRGRKEELNVNGLAHGDLETTWCNFCESRCWDTGTPEPGLTFGVGVKEHPWQRRGSWCCIIGQSGGETDILCPIRGQSRWQLSNAGCQGRETEVGHWSQTCGSSMQSRATHQRASISLADQ